ncbi:MAG TPA: hypothetical protein VK890_07860 [Bacteroidia bacterium]|jgi:hypothetical protein|nr:hypothetical protein [Bacteroidia bacterium]
MSSTDIPDLIPTPSKNNNLVSLFRLIGGLASVLAIPTVLFIAFRSQKNFYEEGDKLRFNIEQHRKYTIGVTTDAKNVRNHNSEETYIYFNYTIGTTKLYNSFQAHVIFKVPKRYYVIYSTEDSTHDRMLPIEVPDSITAAPAKGWSIIPGTRYTVATIEKADKYKASIDFSYNMIKYHGFVFEDFLTKDDIGKKYYISFPPSYPESGVSIYTIADNSVVAPPNGWDKLPNQ